MAELLLPNVAAPLMSSSLTFMAIVIALLLLSPTRLRLCALRRKFSLGLYGLLYLALSRDTKFPLPMDPGKSKGQVAQVKRVIFVRHGESAWNECFNRGFGPSFIVRFLNTFLQEALLLLSQDSLFLDSPLSAFGLEQVQRLRGFVETAEGDELRQICEDAVFVTSTLRRAASTGLLAFGSILRTGRPMWVLSCLQEISRNIDTLSLAPPHRPPPMPPDHRDIGSRRGGQTCLQATFNLGNKSLVGNGADRMASFCEWVFSECSPATLQDALVVAGHSLWFRSFFQAYLPHTAFHEAKHAKMVNCAVVAFDLEKLVHENLDVGYRIVPDSIKVFYGGFEHKTKGKTKTD